MDELTCIANNDSIDSWPCPVSVCLPLFRPDNVPYRHPIVIDIHTAKLIMRNSARFARLCLCEDIQERYTVMGNAETIDMLASVGSTHAAIKGQSERRDNSPGFFPFSNLNKSSTFFFARLNLDGASRTTLTFAGVLSTLIIALQPLPLAFGIGGCASAIVQGKNGMPREMLWRSLTVDHFRRGKDVLLSVR